MSRHIANINWALVISVGALIIIGLINLYSALDIWGETGGRRLFWLQILWTVIGLGFLTAFAFSDYRILERLALPVYAITIILLALTLVAGHKVAGHKSWLGVGGFGIQPSEFAKVAVILVLAKYFANNPRPDGFNFIELIKPCLAVMIPAGIIIMQKDLGSTIFMMFLLMSFGWFGKVKKSVIFVVLITVVVGSFVAYQYAFSPHQKARIITFLNPDHDVKGAGYHMTQSRIAVGSGKIFGKGYLKGNINKLKYLPEKHTDFIFPVLAEEWGFAGSVITLALYFILLSIGIETSRHARDRMGIFLAFGVCSYFFWQVFINLGGVLGLIPLTGITLPFLSYGGSATISTMIMVGILLSISRKRFVF